MNLKVLLKSATALILAAILATPVNTFAGTRDISFVALDQQYDRMGDSQNTENQGTESTETQNTETQRTETQSTETQSTETQSTESQSTETETQGTETESTETETPEPPKPVIQMPELGIADFILLQGDTKQLSAPEAVYGDIKLKPQVNWYVDYSPNPVVSVTSDGTITALTTGSAYVKVDYSYYKDGELLGQMQGQVKVDVSNPTIAQTDYVINIYGLTKDAKKGFYNTGVGITIEGLAAASTISYVSSDANLCIKKLTNILFLQPKEIGNYNLQITVDGRVMDCSIRVYNISFKRNKFTIADKSSTSWVNLRSTIVFDKGKTTTLVPVGFPEGETLTWSSSNPTIVSVNNAGKITARGYGSAIISVSSSDITITYPVCVTYTNSYKAVKYCYAHWQSTYSQIKRMWKDYYDCSSFVWRAYKSAGINIGNARTNYAPCAAAMAYWCVQNNYMLYSGTVEVSKLMPGDLIFWTGAKNGRYKGIYHVDIYIGNNTKLTVPSERVVGETMSNCMVARICGVTNSAVTVSGRTLSWKSVVGATGYQVLRSTSIKGKYSTVKWVKDATSFVDSKAKKGTVYYYKVRPYFKADGHTYYGRSSSIKRVKF